MGFKIKMFLCLFSVALIASCYPLRSTNNQISTDFCSFNSDSLTISYTGSEEGIKRMAISLVSETNGYISTFMDEEYKTSIRTINLLEFDTAILKNKHINIQIWDKLPRSEGYYWIKLAPKSWNNSKSIYFKYNTRH